MLVSVHRPPTTMLLRASRHLSTLQPVVFPAVRHFRSASVVHAKQGETPEQGPKEPQQQPQPQPEQEQQGPLGQLQDAASSAASSLTGAGRSQMQQQQQGRGADMVLPRPPSLRRFNETLSQVQREMDHVLSQFFGEEASSNLLRPFMDTGLGLTPPDYPGMELESAYGSAAVRVDIDENEKEYIVSAEVPGFSKEHVKAMLTPDGILTIKGDVKEEKTEGTPQRPRKSSRISQFTRSFRLPNDVNVEGISATVNHGVLMVTVPKLIKEEIPPKEIPIL